MSENRNGMKYARAAGRIFLVYTALLSACSIAAFMAAPEAGVIKPGLEFIGIIYATFSAIALFYAIWGLMAGISTAAWDAYVKQCRQAEAYEVGRAKAGAKAPDPTQAPPPPQKDPPQAHKSPPPHAEPPAGTIRRETTRHGTVRHD
jgi:hypothetical protein